MGRLRILLLGLAFAAISLAAVSAAQGKKIHKYSVHLTIEASSSSEAIHGDVVSAAPFEICESAKVKIRQSLPGKDKTVAKVKPNAKAWRYEVPPKLHGAAVYAETSSYSVPNRNVRCSGAHSKTITAP